MRMYCRLHLVHYAADNCKEPCQFLPCRQLKCRSPPERMLKRCKTAQQLTSVPLCHVFSHNPVALGKQYSKWCQLVAHGQISQEWAFYMASYHKQSSSKLRQTRELLNYPIHRITLIHLTTYKVYYFVVWYVGWSIASIYVCTTSESI